MMNKLIIPLSILCLTGCIDKNYAEDNSYAHIKKTEIVCKQIRVDEYPISRSANINIVTTSKCIFLKKDSTIVDPGDRARLKDLERLLEN